MSDRQSSLEREDFRRLWPLMKAHAIKRLKRRPKVSEQADDFVQTAFEKVLIGRRKYEAKNYRSYEHFMCSVVDSVISHYLSSWGHKNIILGPDDQINNYSETAFSPEEEVSYLQEINSIIRHCGLKSKNLERLAIYKLKHNITKASEVAQLMNLDVEEVYELDKRLKKVAETYIGIRRKQISRNATVKAQGFKE